MVLYLSIIFGAVAIMTVLNSVFNQALFNCSPLLILLITIIGVIIEIAVQGIFAFIAHSLPKKWFTKKVKIFHVTRRERKFYEKLHIKSWKDKALELGILGGFRKNKIYDPSNPEYLERFIIESNKGLLGHVLGMIFGFLILLYPKPSFALCVGLPIALVNLFLNLLSSMILRYNIPKLTIAYERAKKMKEMKEKESFKNENK